MVTAKEYLEQVGKLDKEAKSAIDKATELRSKLEYKSPSLDGVGNRSKHKSRDEAIATVIEYEQQAEQLRTAGILKYKEIDEAIHAVENPTYRRILELRYLSGLEFVDKYDENGELLHKGIASIMGYSVKHTGYLHGQALRQIKVP